MSSDDWIPEFLVEMGILSPGEETLIEPLFGGVSSEATMVRAPSGNYVVKRGREKLDVADEWFCDPARVLREGIALHWLSEILPRNTVRLLASDDARKAIVMTAVEEPHNNWKELLLAGKIEAAHFEAFATILATIHKQGSAQVEAPSAFSDLSYFETLRLEAYYLKAAERLPRADSFLRQLVDDYEVAAPLTAVHGDASPKNVLIRKDRLYLLDHETMHLGDPAFDIGFTMTHFLSKAVHSGTRRPEMLEMATRFWTTYSDEVGGEAWTEGLEQRCCRHLTGCLLARVDGRSPLPYLDQRERALQRETALGLVQEPVEGIPEMIRKFGEELIWATR